MKNENLSIIYPEFLCDLIPACIAVYKKSAAFSPFHLAKLCSKEVKMSEENKVISLEFLSYRLQVSSA